MLLHTTIIKILQANSLSLADLHPNTQVSLPTLRKAIQELSDSRWICVVGQAEANGGRPAMLFGLDESYYVIIGIHLQLPGIRLVVSDLVGNVLDEKEAFHQTQPSPEQVVQTIIEYVWDIQSRLHDRKVLGVGIAAPGFTDPETGNIISIGRVPGWENFPICERIRSQVALPVEIANDIDCMAFAEFQYSRKSFINNLAYIGFDEGVKVSMFLNGELYKGSFGNAGLVVNRFLNVPELDISRDDQKRMLTISGLNQIFEEKVEQLSDSDKADYQAILQAEYRQRLEHIFEEAQSGDPICQDIVGNSTAVLAAAIANIIYVIQPDEVVIGGIMGLVPKSLFSTITATIRQHLPTLFANQIRIEQAQFLSSNISALGATYHFLENYLTQHNFELLPESD